MGLINPHFKGKTVIMVAYGDVNGKTASANLSPDFYNHSFTNQLVWHEMGHAYLNQLFVEYSKQVNSLKFISDRDTTWQKKAGSMGWPIYLNENITQAVTSLIRIRKGVIPRADEMKRLSSGSFYLLSPLLLALIESQYYDTHKYKNFKSYFPILLDEIKNKYS